VAVVVCALLVWRGAVALQKARTALADVREQAAQHVRRRGAPGDEPVQTATAPLPALPETFGNTTIDGGFALDARGHLVPTEGALRLFNYFFSASGLESEHVILARIRAEIGRRLRPPADAQALALLEDYVAYRRAGRALSEELEDATPEERVKALYALRRARFGARRAAQLFERDEAVREVAMERTRVLRDESLSAEQRSAALAEAESALPEGLRERRAYSTAAARSHETSEALREAGASEAELFEARRLTLGEEGAQRMAVIDTQEHLFRVALEELRTIAADLDGESREAFIAAHFAERDRARARALLAAGFPSH
jgi:lipase chaperone LimK